MRVTKVEIHNAVFASSGPSAALEFAKQYKMLNIPFKVSTYRRKLAPIGSAGKLGQNNVDKVLADAGFKDNNVYSVHKDGSAAIVLDSVLYVSESDFFIKEKIKVYERMIAERLRR